MIQAKRPRKSPKKVWLKDTLEYVVLLLDSRPSEADENIKKPPTISMPIDMRNGMSTLIVFIKLYF
jgi:hypothetical protein